jgi:hypothetical protein
VNHAPRELHRPTPEEIQAACETLLRSGLSRELRAVVREIERNNAEKANV